MKISKCSSNIITFLFSSRRRLTRSELETGVQTVALPICGAALGAAAVRPPDVRAGRSDDHRDRQHPRPADAAEEIGFVFGHGGALWPWRRVCNKGGKPGRVKRRFSHIVTPDLIRGP